MITALQLITSLAHARAVLAAWQRDYNEVRPHSALGWRPRAFIMLPRRHPADQPETAPRARWYGGGAQQHVWSLGCEPLRGIWRG